MSLASCYSFLHLGVTDSPDVEKKSGAVGKNIQLIAGNRNKRWLTGQRYSVKTPFEERNDAR
jgi:hypothetical protein